MEPLLAQRRLVKSPPELWAELSDEPELARHLSEFGDVRITRTEPETTVAWEGVRASGTVKLEPAGWGTNVLLTAVTHERTEVVQTAPSPPAREPVAVQPPAPEPVVAPLRPEPVAVQPPAPEPVAAPPRPEPVAVQPPAPEPVAAQPPAPGPRRNLLTRLFVRKRPFPGTAETPAPAPPTPVPGPSPMPDPAPPGPPAVDPEPPSPEPDPTPPPVIVSPEPEPDLPPAAGPITGEDVPNVEPTVHRRDPLDREHVLAVLTTVLDDLGAAHHRPFSRD